MTTTQTPNTIDHAERIAAPFPRGGSSDGMRWAVVVRHETTRETYVVAPFEAPEDASTYASGLTANDAARSTRIVKLVERQPRTDADADA